jgi:CDP-diacylglycerol---serine O-phosphatidyltransferase
MIRPPHLTRHFREHRIRPPRMRVRRITSLSINRVIPNVLTLLALTAGMTAIRFAIVGKYEAAVISIIVAGIFDVLDGRVARLLHSTSSFGAQLDSLSDFISFGVAPAVVLYIWTMAQLSTVGWVIVVFLAVCCGLRLARFNTQLDVELPPYAYNYFTGVPAPAGAGLSLIPMFIHFEAAPYTAFFQSPYVNAVFIAGAALLMVSRIPTFSTKKFRIHHDYVVPLLLVIGVLAAFLTTAPWPTLTAVGVVYLASIPFTYRQFHRARRAYEVAGGSADAVAHESEHEDHHPLAAASAESAPPPVRH